MNRGKKIARAVGIALGMVLMIALIYFVRVCFIATVNPGSAFARKSEAAGRPSPSPTIPAPEMTPDGEEETPAASALTTPEPTPAETPIPLDHQFMQGKVNVLVLGWDESPERTEDPDHPLYRDEENNFRSDVIMLLVVDFNEKRADLVSIPRDSYAKIYDTQGKWKINAAFAKGGAAEGDGFRYAMETISMLMGDVPIDHYVGVNMDGLKALVDAVGGVDYDVDVPISLNGRRLEMGPQHLDGQQAMDYMRARKGISTDIGRIDRQQRMMMAIFQQMQSSGQLQNIPKVFAALGDMVWTNLSLEQIASLAVFAARLDPSADVGTHTLKGEYMSAYGAYFYVLNQSAKGKLVEELYGFKPKFDQAYDLSYVRGEMAERARLAEEAALAEQAATEAEERLAQEEALAEQLDGTADPDDEALGEDPAADDGLEEVMMEETATDGDEQLETSEGERPAAEREDASGGGGRQPERVGKATGETDESRTTSEGESAA